MPCDKQVGRYKTTLFHYNNGEFESAWITDTFSDTNPCKQDKFRVSLDDLHDVRYSIDRIIAHATAK